jgi:microsomal epoxide hydrolase
VEITPFEVHVPDEVLGDLHERLQRVRWPDEIEEAGWTYGSNLAYMRELIEYWRTRFDWRAQERAINRFAHYRASIDGFGIHFIHERGNGPDPLPLILTHGWPGSFFEMYKLIPMLADPASYGGDARDAFDVVVPSLPGYGFSDRPTRPGMGNSATAALWVRLMTEGLGHSRFAAHGGDIGSGVTARLGLRHPSHLLGIHVTAVSTPYLGPGAPALSAAEREYVALQERWEQEEGAYSHQQHTRPQTLAYGLNDSPVGLASWIVEKFRAWSDCGGAIESRFSKDELLTNTTLYWATETINSSIRRYAEPRERIQPGERIVVPCAIALTREEVDRAPREWAERTYNVQHWTDMPSGGHFLALEEPALLADDLRAFFRQFRA